VQRREGEGAYNEARVARSILEGGIERLTADVVPVANVHGVSETDAHGNEADIHVNWSLFLKNLSGLGRLVVECDVCADTLDKFNLLLRARGRDDLQALGLGELYDDGADGTWASHEHAAVQTDRRNDAPEPAVTKTVSPFFAWEYSCQA
jgi:hypothetical protein